MDDQVMQGQSHTVKVKFYSGYKGEETPRSVTIGHKDFFIEKILERKRFLDHKTGKRGQEFKIKLDNEVAILRIYESQEPEIHSLNK